MKYDDEFTQETVAEQVLMIAWLSMGVLGVLFAVLSVAL